MCASAFLFPPSSPTDSLDWLYHMILGVEAVTLHPFWCRACPTSPTADPRSRLLPLTARRRPVRAAVVQTQPPRLSPTPLWIKIRPIIPGLRPLAGESSAQLRAVLGDRRPPSAASRSTTQRSSYRMVHVMSDLPAGQSGDDAHAPASSAPVSPGLRLPGDPVT